MGVGSSDVSSEHLSTKSVPTGLLTQTLPCPSLHDHLRLTSHDLQAGGLTRVTMQALRALMSCLK